MEALLLAVCGVDDPGAALFLSPLTTAPAAGTRSDDVRGCCSFSAEEFAAALCCSKAASPAGTLPRLLAAFNDGDC